MTHTHTPGPWRIGDAGHTVFGPRTDAPAPAMVAQKVRTMDATLIASAPDLLAALRDARIALTFYRQDMERQAAPGRRDYPFGIDAEESARAAIARAEGVRP